MIAVIAVLIGLLMPALGQARASGRQAVCLANMKQIATGYSLYANDFKGQIWEAGNVNPYRFWYAQPANPRLVASASNPVEIGQAFQYLSNVDRIWGCPTNKRRVVTGFDANPADPYWQTPQNSMQLVLWREFLEGRGLNFDYTMLTGASGAAVGSDTIVAYDTRCASRSMGAARAASIARNDTNLKVLRSAPVYMEEDSDWWNSQSPDGLFSNQDMLSERHFGRGHWSLLDGSAELPKVPQAKVITQGSFTGNDLYASRGKSPWYQVAPTWPGVLRPYGWLKSPRP